MKQTAIEWLEENLNTIRFDVDKNVLKFIDKSIEQAKEMEKENMINFLKSIFQQDGFDYEKAFEQFKKK